MLMQKLGDRLMVIAIRGPYGSAPCVDGSIAFGSGGGSHDMLGSDSTAIMRKRERRPLMLAPRKVLVRALHLPS